MTATAAHDITAPPGVEPSPGWMQSLNAGAAGIALLHIERARLGVASWQPAHAWLSAVTATGLSTGPQSGLFFGAPAAAFVLHAAADRPDRYQRALAAMDHAIDELTHRRLDHAHARIDRRDLPATGEYDLISGLTGLGALLLRRTPDSPLCRDVLTYLVRLTEPLPHCGGQVPGWWTHLSPRNQVSPDWPDGHGNLGMAHGITGPLALLSLAARAGIRVDGHDTAIHTMANWLLDWRHLDDGGIWWPQWLILDTDGQPHSTQSGPGRPSWCYGTPGITRALQLAGQALADTTLLDTAETAMTACLASTVQRAQLVDRSLCHGHAGLYQTAFRMALDARTPALSQHLDTLAACLRGDQPTDGPGLLEGDAGAALAIHTLHHGTPTSDWDACLLLT